MENLKIGIEALVNATLAEVWDKWTMPAHIVNWNFASPDWCCPSAINDVQIGGVYSARMEAKDGNFGFDFKCVYEAVAYQKRLALLMEDGRQLEVTFEVKDNGVLVVEEFDPENENPIDMQRMGWQAILNNFKNYVEGVK
jgi:uncharacterized protein YndB with AHSA1/START domain